MTLWRDIAERAAWTFLQAFLGVFTVDAFVVDGGVDLTVVQTAALAGASAVLSLAKGIVASKVGPADAALPSPRK